jgi:hypothetical protein
LAQVSGTRMAQASPSRGEEVFGGFVEIEGFLFSYTQPAFVAFNTQCANQFT